MNNHSADSREIVIAESPINWNTDYSLKDIGDIALKAERNTIYEHV